MAKPPPEKLAQALRANLRRRKQAAARPQAPKPPQTVAGAPPKPPENPG